MYVPRHNFLHMNPSGTISLRTSQQPTIAANMERQGAPLLDQESLASILVLLFIDDPNLITLRLYRVIRNLCFHIPTRKWIIRSLLSIVLRCNEESMDQYLDGGGATTSSDSRKSYREQSEEKVKWLKLRLDSALGGRANVFLKKLESSNPPLTIHPKASPIVCRHVLELLIFLAKTFPAQFLPSRQPRPASTNSSGASTALVTDDEPMPSTSQAAMYKDRSTDFWEILLRLDNEIDDRTKNRNLKAACKQIKEFAEKDIRTFNESPFGQLIMMLSYDIIRKNSLLTDKLLRLLSLISVVLTEERYKNPNKSRTISSVGLPERNTASSSSTSTASAEPPQATPQTGITQQQTSENASTQPNIPAAGENKAELVPVPEEELIQTLPESEKHLSLAVQVLTSKSCSEEGLEDATSLLINLSQCSSKTKFMIINLLVEGVVSLSHQVEKHVQNLMYELKDLNESFKQDKFKDSASSGNSSGMAITGGAGSSEDSDELSKPSTSRGQLKDRFTKESVIITAPSKVKTTSCDLQLPSMAPLLSKISNQSFFLRILKVITQIRDTVRQDQKSCDPKIEKQLHKLESVPLSELLNLDALWNTLSNCLKELEETQDHHAVLVLQPAVEAFFIVHSTPQSKNQAASASSASSSTNNNRINNNASSVRDNSINLASSSQVVDATNSSNSSANPNSSAPVVPPSVEEGGSTSSVENAENVVNNNASSSDNIVVRPSEPESANLNINNNDTNSVNNNPEPVETQPPPTTTSNASEQQQQQESGEDDVTLARIEEPERPLSPMDTTQSNESSSAGASAKTSTTTAPLSSSSTTIQPQPLSPNQKKFLQFAETHRVVLNQILRQSSTHLADGPFAVLVDHTRVLDFDVKRRYFRIELERLDDGVRREELAVHVHRVNVFEDSFRELYRRNPEEWKNRFYIVFEDEEGQDAGGLLREWYMIISREIFNPMYALFCVSPGDRVTYMINQASHCNPNHLCYFKFVGRVIGELILFYLLLYAFLLTYFLSYS